VAEAVKVGAAKAGLSIRNLARASGVSPAQINRMRAGQASPTRETLVRIARALDRNPNLLLVASAHLEGQEARDVLRPVFRDGSEHVEVWKWQNRGEDVEQARRAIEDPSTDSDTLAELALEVFLDEESEDNLWHDPFLGSVVEGPDSPLIREVLRNWAYLSPERKRRVADYVRDQANLAHRESTDELRKEMPDYGKP
jgi:transcriptional regulator with XRE-family HTH domain